MQAVNPIIPGFFPDPSVCRVAGDYYMVHSSFAYFPGIPIFHSRDLVHFRQIGNVLTRKEQILLDGCEHSEGIYAPTIRYHQGLFYVITTNVSGGGNFYVTAELPEGPWSDPVFLGEDAPGIDPSLFFDSDESCYYVGNRENSEGSRYFGDMEIYIQRLDLKQGKLVENSVTIWNGAMKNAYWSEGPHLYFIHGYYYLLTAEGGTEWNHSICIARSREIFGPYEGCPYNPVFTHRHLGHAYKVVYAGHGELFCTEQEEWFLALLASRPIEGATNLGRETFLAKVSWEDDWPVINAGIGKITDTVEVPYEVSSEGEYAGFQQYFTDDYHFDFLKLPSEFVMLRNPKREIYDLSRIQNRMVLKAGPESLAENTCPAYIAIRQQFHNYEAAVSFSISHQEKSVQAGLAIVQSNQAFLAFMVCYNQEAVFLELLKTEGGFSEVVFHQSIKKANRYRLVIRNIGQKAKFLMDMDGECMEVYRNLSMKFLSTEQAGGFTGCTIGMYGTAPVVAEVEYDNFCCRPYHEIV